MTRPIALEALPREVNYVRTEDGDVRAIEVVRAPRWGDSLLEAPDADVRVVLLGSGRAPDELPPWLGVEAVPLGVADLGVEAGPYRPRLPRAIEAAALRLGLRLRAIALGPAAPSTFREYLAAAVTAIRYPGPVPAEAQRRLEVLATFCRTRATPLAEIAERTDLALEWWLERRFGSPDALADALLVERVRERDVELASLLDSLRAAAIVEGNPALTELAIDRRALLSQLTPWRFIEGNDLTAASAGARQWLRRYAIARASHETDLASRARAARRTLERELAAIRAVERLDSIAALGEDGDAPVAARARALLDAFARFDAAAAAVPLGGTPALFDEVSRVIEAVHAALEGQRQRLASATTARILERTEVPPLDRLLQAIQATNLEGISRALDPRLAAHIEGVLAGSEPA